MKNLKYILFSWLFISALSVSAQSDPAPATTAPPTVNAEELMGTGVAAAEANGRMAADERFRQTVTNIFGEGNGPNQSMQQIATLANATTSSSGLQSFVIELNRQAGLCSRYTQEASACCRDAVACGGSEGSSFGQMASAAASVAPMLAVMFGGENGGGMASCLSSLPSLLDGMGVQEGESQVCRMYREGNGEPGCSRYCNGLSQAADHALRNLPVIQANEPGFNAASAQSQINTIKQQLGEYGQACVTNTQQGEQEAEQASNEMQQSAQSAANCAEAFANEDAEAIVDEVDPRVIDPADISGLSNDGSGVLSKADYDSFGAEQLGGDTIADNTAGGDTPVGAAAANQAGGAGGFPGGMGGFGAGGGPSAKATSDDGKGRRNPASSKASNLISGYGKASSGGSGKAGRKGGKKFKFALDKKKKEKEKKKSKDLAKLLAAAGVSPNSQDNIFERNTKRFVAASVKEKLFDARKNKKLWMK